MNKSTVLSQGRWLPLAAVAVVLLTGCSYFFPATQSGPPSPPSPIVQAATATPTNRPPPATWSAPATLPPPPPGSTPATVPTPTATSATTSGWRKVQDFVPPPSIEITSVIVGGPGFVAVGSEDVLLQQDGCFGSHRDGRLFTSRDGEQWTTLAGDTFAYAKLEHVVESGDALYVLGRVTAIDVALEETPGACGQPPENLGFNVWRSADQGTAWERLAQSAEMQDALVTDIIAVDGVLVAIGVMNPQSRELASSAIWTSADGIDWQGAETLPSTLPTVASSLVSSGNVIVAVRNENPSPFAYSEDGGRNWHQAAVELDPTLTHWSVAARDGRFVAVGGPEPWSSDDYSMSVLASEDGKAWTEVQSLQLGSSNIGTLVALPDRFVGIGAEWDSEGGGRSYVGIRTWASVDGISWLPAPDFPPEGLVTAVAPGPQGIVVATWSRDALWYAPLSTFE